LFFATLIADAGGKNPARFQVLYSRQNSERTRMPKAPPDRSVAAVERTLSILDAFVEGGGSQTLSQLEEKTGLFKSVICRYMLSFERHGYIVRTGESKYRLGPGASRLGRTYERSLNLAEHVMPVLTTLSESTSESVSFYIRDGDKRLCLYRVDSPYSLRVSVQPGSRLPIDESATGQIFRRYSDADTGVADQLSDQQITCSSNVGPDKPSSMSVPVFAAGGQLMGALTVSGPTTRFDPRANAKARKKLVSAAKDLSLRLGA
jgi:DNA-binding IclR family transcriptional regulator